MKKLKAIITHPVLLAFIFFIIFITIRYNIAILENIWGNTKIINIACFLILISTSMHYMFINKEYSIMKETIIAVIESLFWASSIESRKEPIENEIVYTERINIKTNTYRSIIVTAISILIIKNAEIEPIETYLYIIISAEFLLLKILINEEEKIIKAANKITESKKDIKEKIRKVEENTIMLGTNIIVYIGFIILPILCLIKIIELESFESLWGFIMILMFTRMIVEAIEKKMKSFTVEREAEILKQD